MGSSVTFTWSLGTFVQAADRLSKAPLISISTSLTMYLSAMNPTGKSRSLLELSSLDTSVGRADSVVPRFLATLPVVGAAADR